MRFARRKTTPAAATLGPPPLGHSRARGRSRREVRELRPFTLEHFSGELGVGGIKRVTADDLTSIQG